MKRRARRFLSSFTSVKVEEEQPAKNEKPLDAEAILKGAAWAEKVEVGLAYPVKSFLGEEA